VTTAILPGKGWILPQSGRGVSDEASCVQAILDAANRGDVSVTIGERRRRGHRALGEISPKAQPIPARNAPVQPATIHYAREFLDGLPAFVSDPDIYADTDGEVVFEWDFGRRRVFSVSIGPDGTLTYAGLFGHKRAHGIEELAGSIPEVVATNIIRAHRPSS